MYYGIKRSTDLRCPNTEVKKFTSRRAALAWVRIDNGAYTYADPESARNYHHSFKRVYEIYGRINKKHSIFKDRGTRDYPRNGTDNLATYIESNGYEINERD